VNFLRDFAVHLDRGRLSPIMGFYSPNSSRSLNEIEQLGVPVIIFGDGQPSPDTYPVSLTPG